MSHGSYTSNNCSSPSRHRSVVSVSTVALFPASFLNTRPWRSLNLQIHPFKAVKLLICVIAAIFLASSRMLLPSTGIFNARTLCYHATRTFSSSLNVDSLPVFLFLYDSPHLWICRRIFLFFATMEFNMDGGIPSRLATLTRFSVGVFSTSSIIFNLSWRVLTSLTGRDIGKLRCICTWNSNK